MSILPLINTSLRMEQNQRALRSGMFIVLFLIAGAEKVRGQNISLEEALDVEGQGLIFTVTDAPDGNPSWIGQAAVSFDGVDAAEVVVPTDLYINHEMSTTVEGPVAGC